MTWTEEDRAAAALLVGPMPRLEVGSGYRPTPGFVHLDLNPNVAPDWLGPVDDLPWDDETFLEVRAVDVLEHVSYRDVDRVLAEWARVLRPGGLLFVQVPAADVAIRRFLSAPKTLVVPEFREAPPIVSLAWRLLGGHADDEMVRDGDDWRFNAHYSLWTEESLRWYLNRHGFTVRQLHVNSFPNLLCHAVKKAPRRSR